MSPRARGDGLRRRYRRWPPQAATILTTIGLGLLLGTCAWTFGYLLEPNVIDPLTLPQRGVGEQMPVEPGLHIQPPRVGQWYSDPPSSGEHYLIPGKAPAAWGFYPQALRPEYWVHNLAHGGVVVLFDCPVACPNDERQIKLFLQQAPHEALFHEVKLLATPYPIKGHRFALVAWGWRLFMDRWDSRTALSFYESHVDRAPEVSSLLQHRALRIGLVLALGLALLVLAGVLREQRPRDLAPTPDAPSPAAALVP